LLSSIKNITSSDIGFIEKLTEKEINGVKYIKVSSKDSQIYTIVLHATDEYSLDELHMVSQDSIKVLSHLIRYSYVLLGAGCTEFHLSNHLKRMFSELFSNEKLSKSNSQSLHYMKKSLENFINCMQFMTTASEFEVPFEEIIEILQISNKENNFCGWDPIHKRIVKVMDCNKVRKFLIFN